MKKDRLDELLGHALSGADDGLELCRKGMQRFSKRIAQGTETVTVLDSLLTKAYAQTDTPLGDAGVDAGMRRLRNRLEKQPARRTVLAFKPAYALAAIAVAIIALVIIGPLSRIGVNQPSPVGGTEDRGFAAAVKTRNDIVARLPGELSQPGNITTTPYEFGAEGSRESRRLESLDAFASQMRGENFARRVGGNRRTIIAKLTNDRDTSHAESGADTASDTLSPSSRRILLNDKLNRVSEGF